MNAVTKANLATMLAENIGCNHAQAKQFVDVFFEFLAEDIMLGNRVEIRGFGVFDVRETNAKPNARNPHTGEIVHVPARRKVRFKPGKILRKHLSKPIEAEQ